MELRHLRYFVAVADELNFTKAAARLRVSVPPLSRQIRDLERELGLELLVRNTRSVRLTEAGRMFQLEAVAILERAGEAVETMKALAQSQHSRVRVGYAASPTVEILPRTLQRFHKLKPQVRVELHDLSTQAMLRGLRERTLDVALIVSVAPRDFAGLVVEEIASSPVAVAMPPGHRFGRQVRVKLRDVAREPLVTFSREDHPEGHQALAKMLAPYTRSPRIVAEYQTLVSLLAGVEAGCGIALLYETAERLAGGRLLFRPVDADVPPLPIAVAHGAGKHSSATLAFIAAAKASVPEAAKRRTRASLVV